VVKSELCLVLSRPCVAATRSMSSWPPSPIPVQRAEKHRQFDKVLDFLAGARDAGPLRTCFTSPVPDRTGGFARPRFFPHHRARKKATERTQFLGARRTLTLHPISPATAHARLRCFASSLRRPQLAIDGGLEVAVNQARPTSRRDAGSATVRAQKHPAARKGRSSRKAT